MRIRVESTMCMKGIDSAMKNVAFTTALLTLTAFAVPSSHAQDLKQRELIANSKTQVAEYLKATNQKCGTNIVINVDWASFNDSATAPENKNQQAPWAFIVNVTDALDGLCTSDDGKASVKAKIKTISVAHEKTESEKLTGTSFHYGVPYTGATVQSLQDYLRANL